jgi:photosystem II stability/assembly factor-like uncharacterized protein
MKLLKNQKNWQRWIGVLFICFGLTAVVSASDPVARFQGWQTLGPNGGDVREVAIDPKDKNRVLISTLDGQLYSSEDAGRTWRLMANFNRPGLVLDQLIIDPRDSNIIYTSGHRGSFPGGFFKSTDGGVTWKESRELRNEPLHAMAQSSKDPNIILAGSMNGLWISSNSGADWKKIESPTSPVKINSLAIDPTNTNIIYAGTLWRAYKTTDGGKSWRLIKDGMIDDSDVFAIEVDHRNPDRVISSACSGIYDSLNKGERWNKINGIPATSRRTRAIKLHPTIPGTIYAATTEGFWMTSDNGRTWSLTTIRQLEINSIDVHPDEPSRVFIGTNNNGVMVSSDGGRNFTQTNGNFSSRLTYSITPDIEQPSRMYATTVNTATGGGSVFISNDGGNTWGLAMKNINNKVIPQTILQDRKNPNTIYLATNLGIYRSLDRAGSWTQLTPPPPAKKPAPVRRAPARRPAARKPAARKPAPPKPAATTAAAPAKETAEPNYVPALTGKVNVLTHTEDGKDGILAGTVRGLYRTYDPAKGWEKVPFNPGMDEQVYAVTVSPKEPNTIWVGKAIGGVIVSRDGGATWENVSGIPMDIPVSAIVFEPQNPQTIFVGTVQTLYLSRDGGKSWVRRGGNLPLGNYNSILINPRDPSEIFVGSALENNDGIYQSIDGGMNWKRVDGKDDRVPSRRVWSMIFDPRDPNRIFAGTHSGGVFRIERPAMAAKDSNSRPRVAVTGN